MKEGSADADWRKMEAIAVFIVVGIILGSIFGGNKPEKSKALSKSNSSKAKKQKPKSQPRYSLPEKRTRVCSSCYGSGQVSATREVRSAYGEYRTEHYTELCNSCLGRGYL